jgi:tetratricopeptide (TPR) repeat protein
MPPNDGQPGHGGRALGLGTPLVTLSSVAEGTDEFKVDQGSTESRPTGRARAVVSNPQSPLRTPHSAIDPELDWIVMKCLEKDRTRRYETANGLAADLQRHLGDGPVTARPPSAAYQLQKLVRQNSLAFAAVVAVSFTLLAGIIISGWQAVRATRAEQAARRQAEIATEQESIAREQESIARQQSETAQAVKEFLTENLLGRGMSVFGFAESNAISPETTRALLTHAAHKLEGQFTNQPLIEAEIRMAIAFAWVSLGDYTNVIVQDERAPEIRQPLLGPQHSDTLFTIASLANAKYQVSQRQEARKLLAEALAVARSSTNGPSQGAAYVLERQGWILRSEDRPAEAVPYFKEAQAMRTQSLGSKNPQRRSLMPGKGNLAYATPQAG